MPKMSVHVDHSLGKEEAIRRLKELMPKVQARYKDLVKDLKEEWTDESTLHFGFRTAGMNIQGDLHVEEEAVKLDGKLPFAAMMFKGKMEQGLKADLEKLLA